LHEAAQHGKANVLTPLLSHGAIIDVLPYYSPPITQNQIKKEPTNRKLQQQQQETAIEQYASITPLYLAVQNGHKEAVAKLVSYGAKITTEIGILAAQVGNAEIVAELMRNSEKLKLEPLMLFWAALNGRKEVVEMLVESGMAVNGKVGDGMTALHCAAMGGHRGVVEWLVEKGGANMNETTGDGIAALLFAKDHSKVGVVEYFVKRGAL
jgi:ankyrin repeat protein